MSLTPFRLLDPRKESVRSGLAFLAVAALFSLYFASLRFSKGGWDAIPFQAMAAGKGMNPFQHRILIPWLAHVIERLFLPLPGVKNIMHVAFLIEVGSTFGFLVVFRYYLGFFFKGPVRNLLALTPVLLLPFEYHLSGLWIFWLWYDMPTLFFFTLGLALLYSGKWLWYYPFFVVATFNRETTCFLTLAYAFAALGRERLWKIAAHCSAQFILWMGVKLWITHLFAGNPGYGAGSLYLPMNLLHLRENPRYVLVMLSALGYLWLPVALFYGRIRDVFARRVCLIAPFFFVAMMTAANAPELRVYGELIPIVLVAFLLIVRELLIGPPQDTKS